MTGHRLRCSYGGRIIPGSIEKSSYYIGGETRTVRTERLSSLSDLRTLLSEKLFFGTFIDGCCLSIKYQLPGEDLDRLISVTTDQDLHKMYQANSEVQLFLFLLDEDGDEYDLEWNECVSDRGMEDDMEYDMKEYEQKELDRGKKEEEEDHLFFHDYVKKVLERGKKEEEDYDLFFCDYIEKMLGKKEEEDHDLFLHYFGKKELERGKKEEEVGLRLPSSSSSSSSSTFGGGRRHPWKYDVFLSFRGEDTRSNFVSHLYDALDRNGIVTFRDDKSLEKGKSISPELVNAIEDSKVALVILSPNYASSTWCLDELLKIMQCRQVMGQLVIPVFYHLQPSVIRKNFIRPQKKIKYMQACTEHEEVYLDNTDKVEEWSAALTNLANLSGFVLQPGMDETNVIKSIVRSTAKHTLYTSSKVYKGFVGMDSRIDDLLHNYICPWLDDEVRTIGIHGMRGIGKTTVARAVYDHICQNFEHTCFLSNVREMSKRDGLVSLQEKLLSRILMEKIRNIEDEYNGAAMIERRLCKIRVLVVIDDVDQLIQLENLAGSRDWFGPGSRILITTPDVHLLKAHGVGTIYSATGLNYDEALQLLSLKAFKKSCPPEDYLELCHHILGYAHGLPLALAIIGSFLFGRSTNEWKSAIDRLKNKPERSIVDVLRISFDGLRETEKEIFLHIACFFKGKDRDRVTEILDYCQLYPDIGLSVLTDKSLIAISNNKLVMHDMLQEMGCEIVFRESPYNPGKRSRLWSHEDIDSVLKKNKGTEAVQGIVMDLPKLEVVQWNPEAFSKLSQLILLQIHNVDLPKGLTCLSNSLRLLEWNGYPLRSLPKNYEADELIELNLCHSNIEQLWEGTKNLDKLKVIKLCHSQNIVQTPDLTGVCNLESLDLEGCKNLVGLHESIGLLKRLVVLNLKDCESLESLPDQINIESLQTFILSGCSKVEQIPEFVGKMEHLSVLYLDGTAIEKIPASIERLSGLASLNLSNCRNLVSLPSTISRLKSLENLNLSGCLKLGQLQESVGETESLEGNDANSTAVTELPSSHDHFIHIKDSISHGYEVIQESLDKVLPLSGLTQGVNTKMTGFCLSLSGLCNLTSLNLSNCNLGERSCLNDISCLPSLVALNLSGNNFVSLPASMRSLSRLENINLENCKRLKELSGLPSNSKLDVRADGCSSLEMIFDASNFCRLVKSYFNFINCFKLNGFQGCKNIAFAMLETFLHQGITQARETFQIVSPGRNIPWWFHHRSVGDSLTISLPSHSKFHHRFMGFALCAVFVLHEHHRVDELNIDQFKTFNATHHLVCCLKLNGRKLEVSGRQPAFRFSEEFCQIKSDHLWLFYVSRDKYFGTEWQNSCGEIEFLFQTKGRGLMVKKCGIHFIYGQNL